MRKKVEKVPLVMQMEALECGAACLTMILAYFNKWVPLEQVRIDCGISRNGSKAINIVKAARRYGLTASGYRYSVEKLMSIPMPVIIHWNFNHFVVLKGFTKTKAIINDPAKGMIEVPLEEFNRSFTGICLRFEKSESFVPGGSPKSVLSFLTKRLSNAFIPLLFISLTGILTAIIGILNPIASRIFLDHILTAGHPDWLFPLLLILTIAVVIQIIVLTIKTTFMEKLKGKLAISSNAMFMWHVLHLPMDFFSQRLAGDIAARQQSNDQIAEITITDLSAVLINFGLMIFYFVFMLKYNLSLTVIGLTAVFFNLLMADYISKKRMNLTRVLMRDSGKLTAATVSGIDMIETIKASGAENGFFERWAGYQASVIALSGKTVKINQFLGSIPLFLQEICNLLILSVGILLIIQKDFSVGALLAFQGLTGSFMNPVNSLISTGQSIQEMRTAMERIDDVMDYKSDTEYRHVSSAEPLQKLSGELELKNVTFGYSKLEEPIIRDFNMSLHPGSKVAVVGLSGSGKSTLSKVISGLYRPWSGEILYDGLTRDQINREVFTGSVAVVDQDIVLFEDTVADNIKLWDSAIEDFEMILAARDAGIHDDIIQREGGYNHRLLEDGKNFSGGQRQRLEIARVLSQDPTILILDEATSALDSKTESEVIKSIKDRGITCIIIAHRLSTIRDCDEIIVLDHGMIAERGTHEALYSAGGLYQKLISTD
ncbi:NHLP family bacteriocin export ABC transporter peptidase/permease/ATPase subunit [Flexilinea flocculi]|uniref:NHLM bacteriocin system ABC transporter, peptidase/ATP-binding protein n=1 Tax=Flexilinea flocculi TaxID=1678840 RepID=A0A0K8P9J8_9CHLR|nr:NHLP family bacteriocin export ABC transporter peptidase/permease/ATPase subunit [Flexilinea flocculi]GAP39169.1 NHLM bacteriocin system ABC transporter, peptidase/ATP-binding protein [Flexilinea flocculi]